MERLGFACVYLGFGYGVLSLAWWAVVVRRREPVPLRPVVAEVVLAVGCGVAAASLWLTWIEGWTPRGAFVVQSAWVALDPFSTVGSVLLAAACIALVARPMRGGQDRPWVLSSLGVCVTLLVVGNVVIQATTTRGSHLRYGGYVAAVGAGMVAAGSVGVGFAAARRGG